MKTVMSAAVCGFCLVLMSWSAQAQEPAATSAPMSLLGNAQQHAGRGKVIPYTEQASLPDTDLTAQPSYRASGTSTPSVAMPSDTPPAGMRVSYKRAANGSFVKTYVRETGTN